MFMLSEKMKRIYLDTCVWCRPFDEPSQRVTEEAEAFFRILRLVNDKDIIQHYKIKVCAPTEFVESGERKDDI